MPSDNKTLYLGLNQWTPDNYPTREDYNRDNVLNDANAKSVSVQLAKIATLISSLTVSQLSTISNKRIIVDTNMTFNTENVIINSTNILEFTSGTFIINSTAKVTIQCPIIAPNKLIFIDNTVIDMSKLLTFTKDSKGLYIENNDKVYLNWFYQPIPVSNGWFNVASRSVGNWSKLICFATSSFNFQGEINLPQYFDGNMCILYAYGVSANYPNNILVKTDYSLRPQFEICNFKIFTNNLTDKIIYAWQVGGSQYAKFERILISGTEGSPEVQKIDWGLLIKPLHTDSEDIDHTVFDRVRMSNCGIYISTNNVVTRGNITELYFKDCAFGNNGTQTDAPITIYNSGKNAFTIDFNGIFLSMGQSARGIMATGVSDLKLMNISQEYYRGVESADPSVAQYTIELASCSYVKFNKNRFGSIINNNFIKLTTVTDSSFEDFNLFLAKLNQDFITYGDMIMLNISSDSINNYFENTEPNLIFKANQVSWNTFADGLLWDRMDSTKIIGDTLGNVFKNFFGISSEKSYSMNKASFFTNLIYGTKVNIDSANSKVNINRNGVGDPATQCYFKLKTNSKFATIVMNCKITDTVKTSSPIFIGDTTILNQKIIQTLGSFISIRAFLYLPTKEINFSLYDLGGTSVCTLEIADIFIYDGIGGNLYNQLH